MVSREITLNEAITEYMETLPPGDQPQQQSELMRFGRWFGPNRLLSELTVPQVETYQEQVAGPGVDINRALTPLKSFLAFAEKRDYVPIKLAKFVKLRRTATTRAAANAAALAAAREPAATQLTEEGYRKLQAELEDLVSTQRPLIAQQLLEARSHGDIRENAPYDAAKQQQAMVEARVRELQRVLAHVEIISETPDAGNRVALGTTVVLRDVEHGEEVRYQIVNSSEANPRLGKISSASPVGRAVLDRVEGEVVEVSAPAGTLKYQIERIERG